jgi:mRNA-degrading endonuclease RelE of RelBE toxin-antitoxin system
MRVDIEFDASAFEELESIRVFDRRRIAQAIEEQLRYEPTGSTRHRKLLVGVQLPPFGDLPLWELRVGDFRVLYHVVEDVVFVRTIRAKPPHQTTEQVL